MPELRVAIVGAGTMWMSVIAARPGPRLRVRGLNGEYIKHDLDVQEAQLVGGMRPSADGFGREAPEQWGILYPADGPPRPVSTRRGQYGRFYELLRDAVRGDGEPPMDPVDSVRVLRVLDAAELAASTGAVQILASA